MNIHDPYLKPGAKPIFRRGNNMGCLLLHGFSAAPTEISWLGDYLHEHLGMTVYTPRLAGHGTDPNHMRRMHWHDWYASARDGYELLANQCDKVFVAGISMGGVLSLMLAAAADTTLHAAAIIAAPTHFKSRQIPRTPYLKYLSSMRDMPDTSLLPQIVRDEQHRRGEQQIGRTHYERWSVAAVAQMYHMTQEVRKQLSNITTPLLLIYAEKDGAVPLSCSDYIAQAVKSQIVEQYTLNESGHIITQDIERDTAFELVTAFFRERLNATDDSLKP